jgi:hypothetical protein
LIGDDETETNPANLPADFMASINIPAREFPSLAYLVSLNEQEFRNLVDAIEGAQPSVSRKKFASSVAQRFPIKTEEAFSLLGMLFSIYGIREQTKMSIPELVDAITDAATESPQHGSRFSGDKATILKGRLSALLSLSKSFRISLKAVELITEVDRVFCGSRILSDIRSVFSESSDAASGAMIIHNLQIAFHHSGKHDEFYVVLEEDELQQLKETIERAQKKGIALRSIIEKAELKPL